MRPILFKFHVPIFGWDVPLYSYGVMLVLGAFACIWLGERRSRRVGLPPYFCWDIGFWMLIAGVLGARLCSCLENWGEATDHGRNYWRLLAIWQGGLTFYGGFIGAMAAMILFIWIKKLGASGWIRLADVGGSVLALGLAFGRIGCTLNGCCYGRFDTHELPAPLAVAFPPGSVPHYDQLRDRLAQAQPGLSLPELDLQVGELLKNGTAQPPLSRYFTQFYEIAFCLAIFAFLYFWLWPRRRYNGQVALGFLILYPVGRFLEEFLRADNERYGGLLTISQIVSLGLLAAVLPLYLWFRRRARAATAGASSATLPAGKSSAASADGAG